MAISVASCDRKRIYGVGKAGVVCAIGALLAGYSGLASSQMAGGGGFGSGNSGIGLVLPWRVQTGASASANYSDNINLAPSGQERSDLVLSFAPFVEVDRSGPRLRLHFTYSPELLFYTNGTNGSTIRNSLTGTASAVILEEHVFFDAVAQISQQNVSPFGVFAPSSANNSSNRAEARTISLNPYFRSGFGREGTYQLGYRYTRADFNNNRLSTNQTNEIYASAAGGTSLRDLGWSVNYDRQDRDYLQFSKERTEELSGKLTYHIDPKLSASATAGEDRDTYPTFAGENSQGKFYSIGFDWVPSPTTSLRAQHGHRYFGRTDSLQFNHRTRMTSWNVNYNRGRTTSVELLAAPATDTNVALLDTFFLSRYPDPVARGQAVDALIRQSILPSGLLTHFNFLTNQVYLQKRWDASVLIMGKRNSIVLAISRGDQTALSQFDLPEDIFGSTRSFRDSTLSASWTYQLGQSTSANVLAQRTRSNAIGGAGRSNQRVLTASLQHQLRRNLSASLSVRNAHGENEQSKYTENGIVASARIQF